MTGKKRRRKKRRSAIGIVLLCLFFIVLFLLLGAVGGASYVRRLDLSGTWTREIDLTEEVASNIALWLSDTTEITVDTDWVKAQMDPIHVTAVMELEKTGVGKGTFHRYVDETTYKDADYFAGDALGNCMEKLIADRLVEAGYAESVTESEAEAIIVEILGCSMDAYLRDNHVIVMPSYEEVSADINRDGDYVANANEITWESVGNTETESYVKKQFYLVLPDKGLVYGKQVEE